MIVAGSGRNNLWFGTEEYMQFIRTPSRGAQMDPDSWGASGTYLNGGGYARQSFDSHMTYVFEWPDSSPRELAQLIRDYRRGTYGRGIIYFIDPLIYDRNILPSRWADPSIACDTEGASMVYGTTPESVPTSGWQTNKLPVNSAYYDLEGLDSGYRGDSEGLFVPIPEGYTLYLGAFHTTSGNGLLEAYEIDSNGNPSSGTTLTEVANDATNIVPDEFVSGGRGVRIQMGVSAPGAATCTATALIARLYRTDLTPPASFTTGPWLGGMGNSGVRFSGEPTYRANTGLGGGTIGVGASFKEVGDWV